MEHYRFFLLHEGAPDATEETPIMGIGNREMAKRMGDDGKKDLQTLLANKK